ncbi:MAG: RDD family protein [Actinobacteria bacterium]|nr:RDD family protein [Actinomycetota bacterium]
MPAYGAPIGGGYGAAPGQLAEWPQRAVAYLIDAAIIFVAFIAVIIVAAILGAISSTLGVLFGLVGYLAVFVAAFYFAYLNGAKGQSPGKALTGLKVVGEDTGQVIGGGMGIVRQIAHFVDSLICYIGWLFPLWDPKKQTIADKLMHTVVVTGAPRQSFGPDLFKA